MTTNKIIGKLLKFNGLLVVSLAFKRGGQIGDNGKALQEPLSVPQVWPKGKDNAHTYETTQVEGYSCWRMVG